MPRVGPFPSPGLFIFAQVIVHLSHLRSLRLSLSLPPSVSRFHSRIQNSTLSCHSVLIVPSHFLYNQDPLNVR